MYKYIFIFYLLNIKLLFPQSSTELAQKGIDEFTKGDLNNAIQSFREALYLIENEHGKESKYYLTFVNYLAASYTANGNYAEADLLYLEILKLSNSIDNINDLINIVKFNYALLLYKITKYQDSEKYLLELLDEKEIELSLYEKVVNQLIIYYKQVGKNDKADELMSSLNEGLLGNNSIETASVYNSKAATSLEKKLYDEALYYQEKAIQIIKELLNDNHPLLADYYNNLGIIYKEIGYYYDANIYFNNAYLIKQQLGKSHPDILNPLSNLCKLYVTMGDYESAEIYYKELNSLIKNLIDIYFPTLNENDRIIFWNKLKDISSSFFQFALYRLNENKEYISEILNYHLSTKAILFNTNKSIQYAIKNSGFNDVEEKYNILLNKREQLAALYSYSVNNVADYSDSINIIENYITLLEKEINIKLKDKIILSSHIEWENIKSLLDSNEVVIEFIRLDLNNEIKYLAVIFDNEVELPNFEIINNANELEEKYYKYYLKSIMSFSDDMYSYNKYWDFLSKYLIGKDKIYLSADGIYNQINIETLKSEDGDYLSDEYIIIRISNSKDIPSIKNQVFDKENLSINLFGNPHFRINQNIKIANYSNSIYGIDNIIINNLQLLPGTKKEIENIKTLLNENINNKVNIYSESQANEDNLKLMSDSDILHIATHGYFLPKSMVKSNENINNPLFRSGLFFAGVIDKINNSEIKIKEDGILTAYEASNLSLDSVYLAVLSACETGKGEVEAGEGVFGLQRAFLSAGVKNLIMSLWKVDDNITEDMMINFYRNFLTNKDVVVAFRDASLYIKEKYNHPRHWGAFILIRG